MSSRRACFLHIDTSTWPAVDHHALPAERRSKFMARRAAIEFYISGSPLREIAKQTGISSRQLYWLLDRCLRPAEDGQVFGFRALIKGVHIKSYTRTAALVASPTGTVNGYAGTFALLLERYPGLATWLQHKLDKRAVVLDQISTDGSLKTRLRGLASLHAGFVMQCRAIGITGADYPLNTERMGIRSLSTYIKAELLNKLGAAARTAGASRTQALPRPGFDPRRTASRPYQIVEFDGHRLDVRLKIVIRDPLGFEQEVEIERVWLLVIIDVCTRAVLGYNLVLSREYSRYDVIKTIERALVPHTPRTFTLPAVGYGTSGGFPSGRLPELGYALWNRIRLDNARANLAEDTLSVLAEFIGCAVDAGPMHYPNDRPYIERFFGTIGSTLSSRLPGYTGSSPRDVRRALADPKGNLRLFVSLTEIEELMEASIAGYNATPHSGLNGRTPLEAMEYFVRGKAELLSWLPEPKRRTLCLMQKAHRCRVRGYLAQGTRAHINLFQVRYTNEVLAASTDLFGKDLRVYYNSDDLRSVRAFLPNGAELGVLKAQGAWGEIAHDVKLRREILKMRASRRLNFTVNQDFIERFIEEKRAKAKTSRRAATELARAVRILANAPIGTTAAGELPSARLAAAQTDIAQALTEDKREGKGAVEPEVLSIGFGYSSSI